MEFWEGASFGAFVTLVFLALLALASSRGGVQGRSPEMLPPEEGSVLSGRRILPPRGRSVFSRPTVGPKGGTGTPPKRCCCRCNCQDSTFAHSGECS